MENEGRRFKVLLLAEGGEGYGVQRVWDALASGLIRRGHEVSFVMLKPGPLYERYRNRDMSISLYPGATGLGQVAGSGLLKAWRLVGRGISQLVRIPWLVRELRDRHANALIFQSPIEAASAALAARLSGVQAYWMMPNGVSTGYPLDLNRRIYRLLFRYLGLIPLPNSNYTDSTLGAGDFRRHVLHLGIDTTTFVPKQTNEISRSDLGIPENVVLLGLFARMTPLKGQAVLVEALAHGNSDIYVLVCGGPLDDNYFSTLSMRVRELGLSDRIYFVGAQQNIVDYYQLCDVILNTRIDPEPFGMSVIEGMAMGKPVLAHRLGGPSETIIDGETGWLMSELTPEGISEGLGRMLADRDKWDQMGSEGRRRVQELFSEDVMIARVEHILKSYTKVA